VTIIVPTYREVENLPHLIDRLAQVRDAAALPLDLVIVDDDSQDGSAELVAARSEAWIQFVVRRGARGLSTAVLDGMNHARGDILVCMDADLSHPPHVIPQMLAKLQEGADFVVGSRYIEGGSTSDDWGFFRWLNSRVATLLARPFTALQDPMAGFFALKRETFERGRDFAPVGYKIGLELVVRCRCERVVEIPIHFEDRQFGESKLTFRQQLLYLRHLRRLYIFKYGHWSQLIQFLVVGGLGTLVNLLCLTLLVGVGVSVQSAVAGAIVVAMCFNFALNRRFSFAQARHGSWVRQFLTYAAASSIGALVNYAAALLILRYAPAHLRGAALGGIAAGTAFNFLASRYLVFRLAHVRLASNERSTRS
jgi:dolichol-phosphate mannosyltransferase